jgi:hypothetical protein
MSASLTASECDKFSKAACRKSYAEHYLNSVYNESLSLKNNPEINDKTSFSKRHSESKNPHIAIYNNQGAKHCLTGPAVVSGEEKTYYWSNFKIYHWQMPGPSKQSIQKLNGAQAMEFVSEIESFLEEVYYRTHSDCSAQYLLSKEGISQRYLESLFEQVVTIKWMMPSRLKETAFRGRSALNNLLEELIDIQIELQHFPDLKGTANLLTRKFIEPAEKLLMKAIKNAGLPADNLEIDPLSAMYFFRWSDNIRQLNLQKSGNAGNVFDLLCQVNGTDDINQWIAEKIVNKYHSDQTEDWNILLTGSERLSSLRGQSLLIEGALASTRDEAVRKRHSELRTNEEELRSQATVLGNRPLVPLLCLSNSVWNVSTTDNICLATKDKIAGHAFSFTRKDGTVSRYAVYYTSRYSFDVKNVVRHELIHTVQCPVKEWSKGFKEFEQKWRENNPDREPLTHPNNYSRGIPFSLREALTELLNQTRSCEASVRNFSQGLLFKENSYFIPPSHQQKFINKVNVKTLPSYTTYKEEVSALLLIFEKANIAPEDRAFITEVLMTMPAKSVVETLNIHLSRSGTDFFSLWNKYYCLDFQKEYTDSLRKKTTVVL